MLEFNYTHIQYTRAYVHTCTIRLQSFILCVGRCCEELRNHLFKVALLAGALLSVQVVNDVQRGLPLFQLQAFNFCLQLVQLLLQVLALLHVLHPGHGHKVSEWLQLVCW